MTDATDAFIDGLPKAELHVHIEGTLEPELMFALADRNGVALPYRSVEAVRAAYEFPDLQGFLDLYYRGMSVLRTEADFHDLAAAYLGRAAADSVRHAEIFFDPQPHLHRGVRMDTVIDGLATALGAATRRHGITTRLILCFLRDLSTADAAATLDAALHFRDRIAGVGLDSAERGHPPGGFAEVFARARAAGLRLVAHAGEEGPPAYVTEALDALKVERVDHGVRAMEDPAVVARLAREGVPLTVCPLSNVRLRVFPDMAAHPLPRMIAAGLTVTVNSDDPAYFGGYVNANYRAVRDAFGLSAGDLASLARNSFAASFLGPEEKARRIAEVDAYLAAVG
jgi:adenosine deaminase